MTHTQTQKEIGPRGFDTGMATFVRADSPIPVSQETQCIPDGHASSASSRGLHSTILPRQCNQGDIGGIPAPFHNTLTFRRSFG